MQTVRSMGISLVVLALASLTSGCGTLQSVNNLANAVVNTAANTAVKALTPSTYTGDSKETYNSREPLKRRRHTLSSRDASSTTATKRSHSAIQNPPIGMPYRSRNFNGD